jgi:hypothetical protein
VAWRLFKGASKYLDATLAFAKSFAKLQGTQ